MLKRSTAVAGAAIMLVGTQAVARAAETKVNPGRVAWSAFECSTYAELSNDTREQSRLFQVGYTAGKKFVDGVQLKTIPNEVIQEAPVGLLLSLGGPSTDFMLGRIFSAATGDAFDAVVKEDDSGVQRAPAEWLTDDKSDGKAKVARAKAKYLRSNCVLIR